jgi:hypothetical protein
MNETLMDTAYSVARDEIKAAHLVICKKLDDRFNVDNMDTIYRAAVCGKKLWIAAIDFAEKIWAGSLPYEKALHSLQTQFTDFPAATCERALCEAYQETR